MGDEIVPARKVALYGAAYRFALARRGKERPPVATVQSIGRNSEAHSAYLAIAEAQYAFAIAAYGPGRPHSN
jgi:hypothetical protein